MHAQLAAHDLRLKVVKVVVADGAPLPVVVDLHAALKLVLAAEEADVALGLRGADGEQPHQLRNSPLGSAEPKIVNSKSGRKEAEVEV